MPKHRSLSDSQLESLGKNIEAARVAAKLKTVTDGAEKAGVTVSMLSQWENGKVEPQLDGLLRLAVAFQCPLDDFFGGVSEDYDRIIDRRIPINERQQFNARIAVITKMMRESQDTAIAYIASAPIEAVNALGQKVTNEKSKSVRARKKRPS